MTPLDTCDAIERFLRKRLGDMRLPVSGGESPIHFFQMALPQPMAQDIRPRATDEHGNEIEPEYDRDDEPIDGGYSRREARAIFPSIVIRPVKCTGGELADLLTVVFTVGVFDESAQCSEGYKWLVNILERMRQSLEAQLLLEKKYELAGGISWDIYDESLRPFWFGEMFTEWNIYRPARQRDIDDDFTSGNYPLNKGEYPGQPRKDRL